MTRLVETKNELERFIEEFSSVTERTNIEDIRKELKDKDDNYFLKHTLVIQVSRVQSSDLCMQVNNIIYNEKDVIIELGYTYIGTHLRQKNEPVAWITIVGVLKSKIAGKKVVVEDKFETYYIDELMQNKQVCTYYADLNNEQNQEFWYIQNSSQLESAIQMIHEEFNDNTDQYGGMERSIGQIDLESQDMVVALVGNSAGLTEEFSKVEAYKIKMDGIIDIEMGYPGDENKKQRDTIGIVIIPLQKNEISDQEVVVDFR